jgi:hypothetical protein
MAPKFFDDKTHACIFAMACHEKNLVRDSIHDLEKQSLYNDVAL